jgi:hypothetical protein
MSQTETKEVIDGNSPGLGDFQLKSRGREMKKPKWSDNLNALIGSKHNQVLSKLGHAMCHGS